jgi:Tol biopolymer transport system component
VPGRRMFACAGAFSFAALLFAGAGPGGVPRIVTLVRGGDIEAFAQDGNRIAWADVTQRRCGDVVQIRDLTTGKTQPLMQGASVLCRELHSLGGFQHRMALAGTRALWAFVTVSNTEYAFDLYASSPGKNAEHVAEISIPGGLEDDGPFVPVPMAGDGDTLVYVNDNSAEGYAGNVVHRAGGRPLGSTFSTAAIAADGDRFAAARAVQGGCSCNTLIGISPDGRSVVYASGRGPDGIFPGHGWWRLYVADLNGNERALPADDAGGWAVWAPDSQRLLVSAAHGLDVVRADGRVRALWRGSSIDQTWSPDGRFVRFTRYGRTSDIVVMPASGGTVRVVATNGRTPEWSPDGNQLVFTRGWTDTEGGVYLVAADGTHLRRIEPNRANESYQWLPDSRAVVAVVDRRVDLIPVDGSAPRTFTLPLARGSAHIGVSPDGTRLWYAGDEGEFGVLDLGIGSLSPLDTASYASWSPDSSRLAWSAGDAAVKLFDVNTGKTTSVATKHDGDRWPIWSADGTRIAVDHSIIDVDAGTVTTTTGIATDWLPDSQSLLVMLSSEEQLFSGEIARVDRSGASLAQITHATPAPAWTGIQIRRTRDNRILSSFATTGMAQWVALSGDRLALLDRHRIELRRLSGQLIRSFEVSAHVSEISMSGNWIAYLDGTAIDALDTRTGHVETVAHSRGAVVALSIEAGRVAWAEQRHGSDVILAASVP